MAFDFKKEYKAFYMPKNKPEIYMSDARKVAPEKWKTVIRHPIKKA